MDLTNNAQAGASLATSTSPSSAHSENAQTEDNSSACSAITTSVGDRTLITIIRSTRPEKVCKTFSVEDGALTKQAIANVTQGVAITVSVPDAQAMVTLLEEVTESFDMVICPGRWDNAKEDEVFQLLSERALCELLSAEKGKVEGGIHIHNDVPVAARLKRGISDSHWILLDADNPPGIPEKWAKMDISERLGLWEPFLPGITQCERIELRASSARVSATGEFGPATHAWIRIQDPSKLSLLKAHINVQMVLNEVAFEFERKSRQDRTKVVGRENRSVFDLAVLNTGRLVFCAKPELGNNTEGYQVGGANITLHNEGGGAFDNTQIGLPSKDELAKLNARSSSTLSVAFNKTGTVKFVEEGKLRLDTEIESNGEVRLLSDWIEGASYPFHLRCEAPFRDSSSEAAFIGVTKDGLPFVYDIGNSTTYYLSEADKTVVRAQTRSYSFYSRPTERYNDVVTDYIYLEEEDKFYRPYDGAILKPVAVNNELVGTHWGENKKGEAVPIPAVKHFHQSPERRRAKSMGWHPVDELFFTAGQSTLVNTYEGLSIEPKTGDVSGWLSLVRQQYGQYADHLIDHLAFTLQFPERKINWQVLTVGKARTGKSMVMRPIKRIWGAACQVIDPDMMGSGWGDLYAQKKVVVVEEVWRAGEKKFFNSIKAGLVNDDLELLNMKGRGMIRQQNLRSYYMYTNHKDALSFNEDEDKLLVIEANSEPWGTNQQFAQLADYLDTPEGSGAVLDYLLRRDLSNFSYGKLPERTDAMREMVVLSQPDYYRAVVERAEPGSGVFSRDFFTLADVRNDIRKAGYSGFGDKGLAEALHEAGYTKALKPQKKLGSQNCTLGRYWVRVTHPLIDLPPAEQFVFVLFVLWGGVETFGSNGVRPSDSTFEALNARAVKWWDQKSLIDQQEVFEAVKRE